MNNISLNSLVDISASTLERFCKDYSLPIPITKPEYFKYFVETIDPIYSSIDKFNNFVEVYNNEDFFEYSDSLLNTIVTSCKEMSFYKNFTLNEKITSVKKLNTFNSLYNKTNQDKYFVSIDLVSANYQSFKYMANSMDVTLPDTWLEFIKQYTLYKYFQESKRFRQIIFGYLNPKQLQKIQCYLITFIKNFLISNALMDEDKLVLISSDEIVFEIDDNLAQTVEKRFLPLLNFYPNVHINIFKLKCLSTDKLTFYIQECSDNTIKFKGVPKNYFMQVYKKYFNLPLNKYDLWFYLDKSLATWVSPLEWIEE